MAYGQLTGQAPTGAGGGSVVPSSSSRTRYADMNTTQGGVARGTNITSSAWVTTFNYSGTGLFYGFILNLQNLVTGWLVKITIDTNLIFEMPGLDGSLKSDDLDLATVYNFNSGGQWEDSFVGFEIRQDTLRFTPIFPLTYVQNVRIEIRRDAGALNKNFQSGIMVLSKET